MIETVMNWLKQNPETAVAVLVYVVVNLAPRPQPSGDGLWAKLWLVLDRLCLLTSDKVPGKLKFLLLDSPAKATGAEEDAPAESEGDK